MIYEGVFVTAVGSALGTRREGTFTLDADISAGRFTFGGTTGPSDTPTSTLTLNSGGTVNAATGRFSATGASYVEGSATARTAHIAGLILGAGGSGVAGLFTTTDSGTRYAGGFVGSVTSLATEIENSFSGRSGTGVNEGFALSGRLVIPGGVAATSVLFTPKIDNILAEANNAQQAIRDASLLAQVSQTGATLGDGTASGYIVTDRAVRDTLYKGKAVGIAVHEDRYGLARIAVIDASAVTGTDADNAASFVIAGGTPYSTSAGGLAGEYTWQGLQFVGESNALNSVTSSTITFTANFTGGSTAFTATTESGATVRLGGSGTVDLATGRLSGTGFTLTTGGASAATTFQGRLVGVDAISLSGVFANSAALNSKFYAGAVVATGARGIDILSGAFSGVATNGPVLGRGTYALAGRVAADSLFVVAGGSDAVARASHASKTIREASLPASLNPSFGPASNQAVPAISGNAATFNLVTRPATSTIEGGSYSVTAYEDRGGVASLLVVDGGTQLLASGGVAATSIPTSGAYTWDGIQLLSAAGSIATESLGRFRITTTFSGATDVVFTYEGGTGSAAAIAATTLGVTGTIDVSAGTFTSSTRFELGIPGATTITDGLLSGRLFGAGASAVAGLFLSTNTSGARYAGGFVGGGPEAGRAIVRFAGSSDKGGVGAALVPIDAQSGDSTTRVVFLANDLDAILDKANSASDATRAGGILDAIDTTGTFTTTTIGSVTARTAGTFDYAGGTDNIDIDVYEAGSGAARLFGVDGSGATGAPSFIAYVAGVPTGTIAAGTYIWEGVQLLGNRASLESLTRGAFRITATLTAGGTSDSFTYATTGAGSSFTLAGSGTVNTVSGALNAAALDLTPASGATPLATRLSGEITGASGAAVVGWFATTGTSGTQYGGGFVGGGPITATINTAGIASTSDYAFDGLATATPLVAFGPGLDAVVTTLNNQLQATRDAAILARVTPTYSGTPTTTDGIISTTGSLAVGGTLPVTRHRAAGGAARLIVINRSNVTGDSLVVAGGTAYDNATALTGGYTFEGAVFSGQRSTLHTTTRSGVTIRLDFGAGTLAITPQSTATTAARLAGAGTLEIASGTFTGTTVTFAPVNQAAGIAAALSGLVHGAGAGVSGVFATTVSTGTRYGGGFVAGAPILATPVVSPANGFAIGEAARGVHGEADSTGRILFLADDYAGLADELNVTSDALRETALLSSLDSRGATATASPASNVNRYSGVSFGYKGGTVQGVAFEDAGGVARLVILDGSSNADVDDVFVAGGRILSGTLTGTYEYEGVFVTAAGSALGTRREGTFTLDADISADRFTFGGTTGPSDTPTSTLTLNSGGTIDVATGKIGATGASYTEGSGDPVAARIEGLILGAGGSGVAGLFTTTATGTVYAGGFVGSGLEFATRIEKAFTGRTGVSVGEGFATSDGIVIPGGVSATSVLFSPKLDGILAEANNTRQAIRNASFLAQISQTAPSIEAGTASDDIVINRTVSDTLYKGKAIGIKVHEDRYGLARIALIDASAVTGADAANAASFVIAGGTPFSTGAGGLAGEYTWKGLQFVGESNALNSVTSSIITFTANFAGGSNAFTATTESGATVRLGGSGTVDLATGRLSGTGLTLTSGGASAATTFQGRLVGVDAISLSGVFANSVALNSKFYAGAVVATGARQVEILSGTQGGLVTSAPVFASGTYGLAGRVAADSLFVVAGGSNAIARASHASRTIREASLLASLNPSFDAASNQAVPAITGNAKTLNVVTRSGTSTVEGGSYSVTAYEDRGGVASLLVVDGATQLLASGGVAATGIPTSGAYTWDGIQTISAAGSIATESLGRFRLTTTFSGATDVAYIYAGGTGSAAAIGTTTFDVTGIIDVSAGTFDSSTKFDLKIPASSGGTTTITDGLLQGRLFGAGASAVAGLFLTTNASGTRYAGGFVGGGPITAAINAAGIASTSGYAFDGLATSTPLVAFGPGLDSIVDALNSPGQPTRNAAILARVTPTYSGSPTTTGGITTHTGSLVVGGTLAVTRHQAAGGAARLIVINRSNVTGDSLVVAGGTAYDNTPALAGGYTFQGAVFSGQRSTLHTTRHSGVTIRLDFGAGSFAITPQSTATTAARLAGAGTLDVASGTFAGTTVTFAPVNQAAGIAAALSGLVHGAGAGVSGVFATTVLTGTRYGGGFVAGAPSFATRVASPTDGFTIGEAARGVFGEADSTGRILFLADDYAGLADALNVTSDALRETALLSSLDSRGAAATASPAGNVNRYSGVSFDYKGGTVQGVAFEDSGQVARLVILDGSSNDDVEDLFVAGGHILSGTLTGTYQYKGAFLTAAGSALGTRREGTFTLDATISAGSFTFSGTTGPSATPTSTLTLTSGGTVNVTTGKLSATGASYTEGSGVPVAARIEGLILGAGGGGVAGLFTTTDTDTRYAGGFVGSVLALATEIEKGFSGRPGTGVNEGFALSSRLVIPGGVAATSVLFTPKIDNILAEANNAQQAIRNASLLAQVSQTGATFQGGAASGYIVTDRAVSGTRYKGKAIGIAVHEDRYGLARIAVVDASAVTGTDAANAASFVIAGGTPYSTSPGGLAGEYTWTGRQFVGESNALNSVTSSTITFTANFTGGSTAFTATTDSGATVRLGGSGTVDLATGRLSGTGFTLTTGGASAATTFQGRLVGVDAISLSGVFANSVALNSKFYAGAVVATGARGIDILSGAFSGVATNGPVLGHGTYALAGRAAADSLFVVAGGSDAVARASHASKTIREASLLASLNPSFGPASNQAVPAISGNAATFNLVTRSATSTIEGGSYSVTAYEDRGGFASLLVVDGSTQLLASGGVAATSIPTSGAYTWDGIQTISEAGSIATASLGSFRLTATFNGATDVGFIYKGRTGGGVAIATTTLDATGDIVVSAGTFTSSTRFDLVIPGATTITDGLLRGRLFGAGASAVAGLFLTTNTSETRYAGGFVGGGPEAGRAIVRFAGSSDKGGVGAAPVPIDAQSGTLTTRVVFLANDLDTILNEANSASDATRAGGILDAIDTTGTFTATTIGSVTARTAGTFDYAGGTDNIDIDVYEAGSGAARLFGVDGSGAAGAPSFIAYVAGGRTGTIAAGEYRWEGVQLLGNRASLQNLTRGAFRITATLTAGGTSDSFSYATIPLSGASSSFTLSGDGTVNTVTGALSTAALDLTPVSGGSSLTTRLSGEITGASGAAVVGWFATTGTNGTQYGGGFVGGGPTIAAVNAAGIVSTSDYAFDGLATATPLVAFGPGLDAVVATLNNPLKATRDAAILARVTPTYSGTPTTTDGIISTTGSLAVGGTLPVTRYQAAGDAARLIVINRSNVTGDSLVVAGGTAYDNATALTGGYTFEGAVFSGQRSALHTTTRSGVTIRLDFGAGTLAITPQSTATTAARLAGAGTLEIASGTFTGTTVTFAPVNQAAGIAAALSGLVHGAGTGVSGVFATTVLTGVQYGGGFVAGAPAIATSVASPANGLGIGATSRGVLGGADETDSILFLTDDYDGLADELNVTSDALRETALLSSLDNRGATATASPASNVIRYSGLSFGYKGGTVQGVAFEDSGQVARLVLLDGSSNDDVQDVFVAGGRILSGTLTGTYKYEGVFVTAVGSALGTRREGTFTLDADISANSFTFAGATSNGNTTTSRLTLNSGGTVNAATGRFSAPGASYVEGSGTAVAARIEGLIVGADASGVAGLFTTTATDAVYAGGFVGSVLEFASRIENGFTGRTGVTVGEGFATSTAIVIPGGGAATSVLFAPNLGGILAEANNAQQTIRDASFLAQISQSAPSIGAGTASGELVINRTVSDTLYRGASISIAVHEDRYGLARIAVVDALTVTGTNAANAASFVIAGGAPYSASQGGLQGEYTWQGLQFVGESNTLSNITSNTITFTANFAAGSRAFTATTESGATLRLGGSGTVDVASGRLTGTGLTLTTGGASAATTFEGRLVGVDGASLSGVFANSVALNSKFYAGAVVATGAGNVEILSGALSGTAAAVPVLARGNQALAGRDAAESLFLLESGSNAVFEANHASRTIRESSLLANLNPTFGGASSQVVPTITGNAAVLNLSTRSGTVAIGGDTYSVTAYEDRRGVASLLVVDGQAEILAAGGVAATGIPTAGRYTWYGIQALSRAGSVATASLGRFRLTTTFSAAASVAFTYTGGTDGAAAIANATLTVPGTIDTSTGTLESGPTGFALEIPGVGGAVATVITSGALRGRLAGAAGAAVSGLFVTTDASETRYAGGFVGGGPEVARATVRFAGARDNGGVGEALVPINAQSAGTTTRVVFLANDLDAILNETNSPSDTVRTRSILDRIVTTGSFTSTQTLGSVTAGVGGNYAYRTGSVDLDIYQAGAGAATLLAVDGSSVTGAQSYIGYLAGARTGTIAAGAYVWEGAQIFGNRASLETLTRGSFRIAATLTSGGTSDSFTYSTIGASPSFTLSGTGTVNPATGALSATALELAPSPGATPLTTRLAGEIAGASGAAVVGWFATTGTSGTQYGGGFVGGGPITAAINAAGIASTSGYAFDGLATETPLVAFGPGLDAVVVALNSPLNATRGAAILARVTPTYSGSPTATDGIISTTGSLAVGGTLPVTRHTAAAGAARLIVINRSNVTGDSLVVAGGTAYDNATALTGGYTFEGAVFGGQRSTLHTTTRSGVTIRLDFGAGTLAITPQSTATTAARLAGAGTLEVATGTFTGTSITFTPARTGTAIATGLEGLVHGAGAGVSGVFATTNASGAKYGGGFVAGTPRFATRIANPTNGLAIGAAARGTFRDAHSASSILFLSDDYDSLADALNVTSDTLRDTALLSSLGVDRPASSTASPVGNVNRYDGLSLTYKGEQVTANLFEDTSRTARFVFLDGSTHDDVDHLYIAGGTALSGTLSGTYTYEGVFVSAAASALGTRREGKFDLRADITARSFTFTGTTGPAAAPTSRLTLNSVGTVNPATGLLAATDASYVEGTNPARAAIISARLLGADGFGVAGLFTTTATGAIYGGGFAGSVLALATEIENGFAGRTGTGVDEGFGQSGRIVIPGGDTAASVFFTPKITSLLDEANNAVPATRDGALLAQISQSAATPSGGTAIGDIVVDRTVSGTLYKGKSIGVTVHEDRFGLARIAVIDASAVTGADAAGAASLLIAGGAPFSGSLQGEYTWRGRQFVGDTGALGTLTSSAITFTADFGAVNKTFTAATESTAATRLGGSGSVDVVTGRLSGTGLTLTASGKSVAATFEGRLVGADAISLVGVFANNVALNSRFYAGGVIATGARELEILSGALDGNTTDGPVLVRATAGLAGRAAGEGLFVVAGGSDAVARASHASRTVRESSLLSGINPAFTATASQSAPQITGNTRALDLVRRSGTTTVGGDDYSVSAYEDRGGLASLLVVDGDTELLASGGVAATGIPTSGGYTWEGIQILSEVGSIATESLGRFRLTTTFNGASDVAFTYAGGSASSAAIASNALVIPGSIDVSTGRLLASTGFDLTIPAVGDGDPTNITDGLLRGRLFGAGAQAVSGLFLTTNTSGTRYTGGFVGGGPQVARAVSRFAGASDDGGVGTASVTIDAQSATTRLVFLANDLDAILDEANSASDVARAAGILDSIDTTGSFTASTIGSVAARTAGTFDYAGGTNNIDIDVYAAGAGAARLFGVDSSGATGAESFIAYAAGARTGTIAAGTYIWEGVQLLGSRADLDSLTRGAFRITATLTAGGTSDAFTYASVGATRPFTLSGSGTINVSTGTISAAALQLAPTAGATPRAARLSGVIAGAEGAAVVGWFATTGTGGTQYGGGFVGGGSVTARIDAAGIVSTSSYAFDGGVAAPLLAFGPGLASVVDELASHAQAVKDATIIANLAPTYNTPSTTTGGIVTRAGSLAFGGTLPVARHTAAGGAARLVVIDRSNVASADSLVVAGGTAFDNTPALAGSYTFEGVAFSGRRATLHTTTRSGVTIGLDFAAGSLAITPHSTATTAARLAGTGTLDAATGAFRGTAVTFTPVSQTSGIATALAGLVHGAGVGVSGVFATTAAGGTRYGGGFLAGAPRIASSVATPANGFAVGEAARGTLGDPHSAGTILFLAEDYDALADELNVTSDVLRRTALLSSLGASTGTAATSPAVNVNKQTGLSFTYKSAQVTGTLFQDTSNVARLIILDGSTHASVDDLLVAGGRPLAGALTGTYEYEGVFVSAAGSASARFARAHSRSWPPSPRPVTVSPSPAPPVGRAGRRQADWSLPRAEASAPPQDGLAPRATSTPRAPAALRHMRQGLMAGFWAPAARASPGCSPPRRRARYMSAVSRVP